MSRYYVRNGMHYGTADDMIDCIDVLDAQALANRVAIMRLEAKLAKAVDGFESIRQSVDHQLQGRLYRQDVDGWEACMDDINYVIRKILKELTGGKDE